MGKIRKLGLAVLTCLFLVNISACLAEANGSISREWVSKIENIRKAPHDKENLMRFFNQEAEFLKEHRYPMRSLPKNMDTVGYEKYFNELCLYVSKIPDLDDNTVKYLLMYAWYKPWEIILQNKERFWPLLRNWANEPDRTLREETIKLFRLISVPPVDSDDTDTTIFRIANTSLTEKEKGEVKEILLKASYDPYVGIRVIAVSGLLPYAKDEAVASRLHQLAAEDPREDVRDPAQEILELGRIRSEVERARLKREIRAK